MYFKGDMGQKCVVEGWLKGDWWACTKEPRGLNNWSHLAQILNQEKVTHAAGVL